MYFGKFLSFFRGLYILFKDIWVGIFLRLKKYNVVSYDVFSERIEIEIKFKIEFIFLGWFIYF